MKIFHAWHLERQLNGNNITVQCLMLKKAEAQQPSTKLKLSVNFMSSTPSASKIPNSLLIDKKDDEENTKF